VVGDSGEGAAQTRLVAWQPSNFSALALSLRTPHAPSGSKRLHVFMIADLGRGNQTVRDQNPSKILLAIVCAQPQKGVSPESLIGRGVTMDTIPAASSGLGDGMSLLWLEVQEFLSLIGKTDPAFGASGTGTGCRNGGTTPPSCSSWRDR
jgi:hypothetical protein